MEALTYRINNETITFNQLLAAAKNTNKIENINMFSDDDYGELYVAAYITNEGFLDETHYQSYLDEFEPDEFDEKPVEFYPAEIGIHYENNEMADDAVTQYSTLDLVLKWTFEIDPTLFGYPSDSKIEIVET